MEETKIKICKDVILPEGGDMKWSITFSPKTKKVEIQKGIDLVEELVEQF